MIDKKVILVIDDVESVVRLIQGVLQGDSFDIVTASDGESGLAFARQLLPDLVLLDLAMPILDGWSVLTAMREDPKTSSIPIVIVTAHGESDAVARATELGADGFLSKPFRPAELRRLIESFFDESGNFPATA